MGCMENCRIIALLFQSGKKRKMAVISLLFICDRTYRLPTYQACASGFPRVDVDGWWTSSMEGRGWSG